MRAAEFAIVAALIAAGTVLTLAIAIFGLSGHFASGPSLNHTSENSHQAKETVAVKIPQIEQRAPDATPPPPPVAPPTSLRGLDQIPLDSGSAPTVAQAEPKPKAFDPSAEGKDVLPWGEVEPFPVAPPPPVGTKTLPQPPEPARPALSAALPVAQLPTVAEVSSWLKSKMAEIKGEDRARPLVHFEFWLEPPTDLKRHIVAVTYNFSTPAISPQSQTSRDAATGFRIAVGGLGCADTITVTLEFDDGRTQPVDVDGCRSAEANSPR